MGGFPEGSNNYCEVDKLFTHFQNHARKNGINEENVVKIKCNATFSAMDLEKTHTYDSRSTVLKSFLKQNPDICLLNVDKSISVCFIDRKSYHEKLTELFEKDNNFERVVNYDHEEDFKSYNKLLLETLGNNLSQKTLKFLEPNHSISSAYETIKLHKEKKDLRPIITGYNSMVDNAHEFIKNLLEPISKNCDFSTDGPKQVKERLLKDCKNFNSSVHEIVSFDASKLYTSVNTTRVISEILKIIYKNPSDFFKEKDENDRLLPFPKRANLRKFMHSVL